MKLDLKKISAETMPQKKVLFKTSNGNFYINEEWVITFDYQRKPDLEKVAVYESTIHQLETELKNVETITEEESLKREIRNQEKLMNYELQDIRISPYFVILESEEQIKDFIWCLKMWNENTVWSCAYSAWLRFEENTTEESLDNQMEHWKDSLANLEKLARNSYNYPRTRENKRG